MTQCSLVPADFGSLIRNPIGDEDPAAFGPRAEDVVAQGFYLVDMLIQAHSDRNVDISRRNRARLDEVGIRRRRHFMFSHEGETYASNAAACGNGIIDPSTSASRIAEFDAAIPLAQAAGFENIGVHAGTISQAGIAAAAKIYRERCIRCADAGLGFVLETSAVSGAVLAAVAAETNHPALILNFDPANHVWYGQGDPLDYLHWVGRRFDPKRVAVHGKDIITTGYDPADPYWRFVLTAPGKGCGYINWAAIAKWFVSHGNVDPWVIEHEPALGADGDATAAKARQVPEIVEARTFLGTVCAAA